MSTTQPTNSSPTSEQTTVPSEWLTVEGFNELFRTDPEFASFARNVYDYLDRMRMGRIVSFSKYEGKELEWCIRTAAAFICEGDHWADYTFGDDFLSVHKRRRPWSPTLAMIRRKKKCPVAINQQLPEYVWHEAVDIIKKRKLIST